jgi:hypothetical protein
MRVTKHRTQLYLDGRQYRYLAEQAEREGISLAEVVRRLIEDKLSRSIDYESNPFFRLCRRRIPFGRRDGSVRHDDYIYRGRK